MLDDMLVEYESVDTLDEIHNHNLRNVLKQFGNWPTIPQVYHNGEFLGGHDILDELQKSGKLAEYSRLMSRQVEDNSASLRQKSGALMVLQRCSDNG